MARSLKKGPFVHESLMKKIENYNSDKKLLFKSNLGKAIGYKGMNSVLTSDSKNFS